MLAAAAAAKAPLVFRTVKDSECETTHHTFKILQLADVHYGEAPSTEWGPAQDAESVELIKSLVLAEQPDLIVLSGDQLTSDYIKRNATAVHADLIKSIQVLPNIRWCIVMGNHDDHPYETFLDGGSVILADAQTTREELLQFDSTFEGSRTVAGQMSTYMVPIFLDRSEISPAVEVYILDTGGGSIAETIEKEQVDWFVEISSTSAFPLPAIAFQHIASNNEDWAFRNNGECKGTKEEKNTKTVENDAGLLNAMIYYGDIHFVSVGHNHGFSYCCAHEQTPLHICYGRHSGYGGYEKVERGARIYELHMEVDESSSTRTFTWKSWVRLASGNIADQYTSKTVTEYPSPPRQTDDPTSPTYYPIDTASPTYYPTIGEIDTEAPSSGSTASPPAGDKEQTTTEISSQDLSYTSESTTQSPTSTNSVSPDDLTSGCMRASGLLILAPVFVAVYIQMI